MSATYRRRRLLVIATIEIPTDRDWTLERMKRDVQGALTDYGYFVVHASVESITEEEK
jgi:hypothetical protein